MYNLLADSSSLGNLVLIIILLVACAGMFILSYFRNKKYAEQQKQMQEEITVGSKVLTKTFIYGTIEKITETTDGKVVLIKSGEGDKVSYFAMNMEAIYSLDKKEEVVDIPEEEPKAEIAFKETEEVKKEETKAEEVKAEKPKTTTKTTAKKTTKKQQKNK